MDEQTGAFFVTDEPAPVPASDEPILMGAPPVVEDATEYDFAGAPPVDAPAMEPPLVEAAADDVFFAGPPPPVSYDNAPAMLIPEDVPQPSDADPFGAPVIIAPSSTMDGAEFPPAVVVEPVEKEESPMTKWNNEWQVILKERKDAENAAKAEQVEAARLELENFQKQRETKRETRMAKNRSDEQSKLEAMEADLENDNSWQKAVKLVDFQQDSVEGGSDVSRMRDVMITLKNDATRAVALA